MNVLEKLSTGLRHSKYLNNNYRFWNFVRPLYNRFIEVYGKNGLQRNINGRDKILVLPEFRGVSEIYEPDVWHHLMNNIKVGDKVVDVGSYIGLYAIAIGKRVGTHGKVFAFEPDPINFQSLKSHISLNLVEDIVEPINMAVADKQSIVNFQSGRNSQSSIQETYSSETISVHCVSLDEYFQEPKVDIVKIDVEGYEEKVLEGCHQILSNKHQSPRLIYIEVHPFAWEKVGTSWNTLLNLLSKYDYEVFTLDGTSPRQITWWGEIIAKKIISF
ncbi:FkbM family methyltransferase [Geminocystis sp. NIES-3709]|uniref:FkbM family methyltransferase n=1 Tax=Geminocystis sp. NIES-3709 TaxID=1617448 RepID=UPI0005FC9829|nr:FkbM family methyltransferase [Geminocystis sp. NIES-3709]BAQ66452.1 methyltransferase [Geminocystis sp. NIES-3709]